jgi:chemotaxis protein histidine kinase CheA
MVFNRKESSESHCILNIFFFFHLSVDTPLSESRYSQLFDGWVDESREQHDDHAVHGLDEHEDEEEHEHEILESLNELDSHEHDQESFAEEPEAQEDEAEEDLEPEDAASDEENNLSAEVNYNEPDVSENVQQSEEVREEAEPELPESAEAKDSFENGDEPFEEVNILLMSYFSVIFLILHRNFSLKTTTVHLNKSLTTIRAKICIYRKLRKRLK